MINLEHRLTVDDLIVEYAIYKVKNGYEPKYSWKDYCVWFKKERELQRFAKLWGTEENYK